MKALLFLTLFAGIILLSQNKKNRKLFQAPDFFIVQKISSWIPSLTREMLIYNEEAKIINQIHWSVIFLRMQVKLMAVINGKKQKIIALLEEDSLFAEYLYWLDPIKMRNFVSEDYVIRDGKEKNIAFISKKMLASFFTIGEQFEIFDREGEEIIAILLLKGRSPQIRVFDPQNQIIAEMTKKNSSEFLKEGKWLCNIIKHDIDDRIFVFLPALYSIKQSEEM